MLKEVSDATLRLRLENEALRYHFDLAKEQDQQEQGLSACAPPPPDPN